MPDISRFDYDTWWSPAFDTTPDFIFLLDNEYYIRRANAAFLAFAGVSANALIGKKCFEIVHGTVCPVTACPHALLQHSHAFESSEFYEPHLKKWLQVRVTPICDAAGALRGSIHAAADITERKISEEKIKSINKNYERLLDDADEAIFRVDAAGGQVTYVNAAAERMFGYSARQWQEGHDLALTAIHPDYRVHQQELLRRLRVEKKPIKNAVLGWQAKGGRTVIAEHTIVPTCGADGELLYFDSMCRDITERKAGEERLRLLYRTMYSALESAPFGVYIVNEHGKIDYVNYAMLTISGADYSYFHNLNVFTLEGYARIGLDRKIRQALAGESFFLSEVPYTSAGSGKTTIRNFTGVAFREGTAAKALIFVEDITLRKKSEEAILREKKYAELIYAVSPSAIFTVDKNRIIRSWNKRAQEITGFSAEEILGRPCTFFAGNPCTTGCGVYSDSVVKPIWGRECTIKRKDGITRIVSKNADVLKNERGEIIGGIESFDDITERKQMADALARTTEELNRYFNASLDLLCIADMKGCFKRVNPAWETTLGYPVGQLINRPFFDFVHPDDMAATRAAMAQLAGQHEVLNFVNRYRCTDGGYRWIEWRAHPEGELIYSTARDITQRKLLEENFEKINNCFLQFGSDPLENITMLTALCGGLLGAECALYNRLAGNTVCSIGQWNTPQGYVPPGASAGHICYDVITRGSNEVVCARNLSQTAYARTDPHVAKYAWQTYIGKAIKCNTVSVGSLCCLFTKDRVLTEIERRVLEIIAAAISVEEERRHTADALNAEKKFLRLVIDRDPNIICVKNRQGVYRIANEALAKAFQVSVAALEGKTDADFSPTPQEVARFRQDDAEVLGTKSVKVIERENITYADGSVHVYSTIKVPLFDENGACNELLVVATDITERQSHSMRMQYLLRELECLYNISSLIEKTDSLEHLLQGIVSLVPSGFRQSDSVGCRLAIEEKEYVSSGFAPGSGPGIQNPIMLYGKQAGYMQVCYMAEPVAGQEAFTQEEHWLLETIAERTSHVVGRKTIEDNLFRAKEDLERKNTELLELDRLKTDFIFTVSHELRTPLTPIRESVSLMVDGVLGAITEKQKSVLGMGLRNIDRLHRLINDLLDMSRIESGRMRIERECFDMREVFDTVAHMFEAHIKNKGLVLENIRGDEPIEVYADRDRMVQVMTNLVGNAIKFTGQGFVRIAARRAGAMVECSVADSGKGIAEADIPKLFGKFQQLGRTSEEREGGTGLGLSICKGIVEAHGGAIRAHSTAHSGTVFTFTVPVYHAEFVMREYISRRIETARHTGYGFVVSRMHIDNYAELVRALGQPAVDIAGERLVRSLRVLGEEGDSAFSQGEGLFVAVLSCFREDSQILRERLCRSVKNIFIEMEILVPLEFSWGTAYCFEDGGTTEELLARAAGSMHRERDIRLGKTILIADDEPRVADALEKILRTAGYTHFMHAADGEQVFACIGRQVPDLIVVDMQMPRMNGYEVVGRLKGHVSTKDIPVLIMSGYQVEAGKFAEYIRRTAIPVIGKPFDAETVVRLVDYLL